MVNQRFKQDSIPIVSWYKLGVVIFVQRSLDLRLTVVGLTANSRWTYG